MSDIAASVRARLLNVAKAQGLDFQQVLVRFALERILYRLTQSRHADCFLFKGARLDDLPALRLQAYPRPTPPSRKSSTLSRCWAWRTAA
jgi:hypothetical protein